MGWSPETRIYMIGSLTLAFFFLEIVTGMVTHSMALVADSFHMLSDLAALIIGLISMKLAKSGNTTHRYTYGFRRAEVLGAFANGVLLLSLCFSIIIEAIQRFFEPVEVEDPQFVLIVGSCGLAMNLIGMFLFRGRFLSSRVFVFVLVIDAFVAILDDEIEVDDDDLNDGTFNTGAELTAHHDLDGRKSFTIQMSADGQPENPFADPKLGLSDYTNISKNWKESYSDYDDEKQSRLTPEPNQPMMIVFMDKPNPEPMRTSSEFFAAPTERRKARSSNMRALFLHALGDAAGNLAVMASSLIIMFVKEDWRFYSDPVISIFITIIIGITAVELVRSTADLLLQGVPGEGFNVEEVKRELEEVDGVHEAKYLRVWALNEKDTIASVHCRLYTSIACDPDSTRRLVLQLKGVLRNRIEVLRESTVEVSLIGEERGGRKGSEGGEVANERRRWDASGYEELRNGEQGYDSEFSRKNSGATLRNDTSSTFSASASSEDNPSNPTPDSEPTHFYHTS
ncbi:hypothetical protein HDU67_006314, partial [Dinochytrium kinnereticum]